MDEFLDELEIKDRVLLETQAGPRTVAHRGTIANLTAEEIWVAVGRAAERERAPRDDCAKPPSRRCP